MTPRHPTSLIAESILADSAPRTFPGRTSNHDTPPAAAAPPQEPAARKDRIEHRILAVLPDQANGEWPTQAEIARTLGEPVTLVDSMVYWLYERGRVVHDGQWPHRWARVDAAEPERSAA